MKVKNLIFTLFFVVGILFLAITAWSLSSGMELARNGIETTGEIVDLDVSISDDKSKSYFPIIEFTTQDQQEITFRSSMGSSSYRGSVGQQIEVLYNPKKPSDAVINSMSAIYGGSIILAIFGVVFTLIGGIPMVYRVIKNKSSKRLLQEGLPTQVKITDVILNEAIKINNRSPYQIIADNHDKATNTVTRYKSENIYFDPSPYIDQEMITIYIDRKNAKKYYMDVRFLPKIK